MFKKDDYPLYIPSTIAAVIVGIGTIKLFNGFNVAAFLSSIFWGVVLSAIALVICLKIKSKKDEEAAMRAAREKARAEVEEKERRRREAEERQAQLEAEWQQRREQEARSIELKRKSSQETLDSIPKRKITFVEKDFTIRKSLLDMPQLKISTVRKDTDPVAIRNYVVIDVETTGLDADHDEIVEVAAIRYSNDEIKEAFQTYVKPITPISEKVSKINGITNEMLENAPHFSQIAAELEDFIGTSNLVGHNIEFDIKFLYAAGYDMFRFKNRKYYDTLKLAHRVIKPDEVTSYKLSTLIHEYSGCFESANSHSALSDCLDTLRLFNMLLCDLGIYKE